MAKPGSTRDSLALLACLRTLHSRISSAVQRKNGSAVTRVCRHDTLLVSGSVLVHCRGVKERVQAQTSRFHGVRLNKRTKKWEVRC